MLKPALAASLTCLAAAPSWGFSVGTIATQGCHERITLDAARAGGLLPHPESVTAADRTLLASLPFQVDGAWDRGTLALLISVRDNDFHGIQAANFAGLSEIHFSPRLQHEHCLRAAGNDGTEGDQEALALCREYILEELRLAATATPGTNVEVEVALVDETRKLQLPAFQVHLGRALHALEDSFAHSLREDGFTKVRSVFNYVDPNVGNTYRVERDGHGHVGEFDACEGGIAAERAAAATRAAAAMIASIMLEDVSAEARLADAEVSLDHVLRYEPACGDGAAWCPQASELLEEYLPPAVGCSTSGAAPLWALGLLGVLALRRRSLGALGAVVLVTAPLAARAEEPVAVNRLEELSAHEPAPQLRVIPAVGLGASIDRGAGVISVGARLPIPGRVEFSADLEFNPWFDLLAGKASLGALNAGMGLSVRWLTLGPVELRSGVGIGASLLLHDTVSAEAGSIGPFAQLSILNVLFPGPGKTHFELRPDAVLTIPSLRGIPLAYHQYRLVLTLRLG